MLPCALHITITPQPFSGRENIQIVPEKWELFCNFNCQSYKVIPGSLQDTWVIKVQSAYLKVMYHSTLPDVL